jgi:hypothetical protein
MPLPDSAADGEEKMPLPDSAAVESRFWLEIRFLVGPRGRPRPRFAYYKKTYFCNRIKMTRPWACCQALKFLPRKES